MNIVDFPIEKLIKIVSDLLDAMMENNNKIPNRKITYFHSRTVPNITIFNYLTRIHKFAPFTNETLVSILIYFDRISKLDLEFNINSLNIHRLLITSIVVASKFTSDIYYANNRYAKVGGIPNLELNQLELEFLFLIDFQLYISLEDLTNYINQLFLHSTETIHHMTESYSNLDIQSQTHLPLTPPPHYLYPSEPKEKKLYHPYKKPTKIINKKKKIGLISPKH